MKIGTLLNYSGDFLAAIDEVVALENAGLDAVWVPEAYSFDAVTVMGFLAARTERIEIGSGILPIYTRTPTLMAMTAAGLDALSGGRAVLGLGASGPQVIEGFHGVTYDAPVGRTRETIEICRQVWRREKVNFHGKHYDVPLPAGQGTGLGKSLKLINHPVRENIPILVASLGDKNVEMTAEIANQWLPIWFWPERSQQVWGDSLAKGLAKRDQSLGPLDIIAGAAVAIGDDVDHLRELARPMAALYFGGMGAKGKNFYNNVLQRYGYEEVAEELQDLYLAGRKDEAAALVPDELLASAALIGSESFVKDRLRAMADAGVTYLNISPIAATTAEKIAIVEQLKSYIDEL
ncbi:MAG: LLM class F420-dependent oxidoreductase [Actinobacteria bacterium]|nr:LLM class F420-dependent oxidoreductase [Actinomycetota bacterium]